MSSKCMSNFSSLIVSMGALPKTTSRLTRLANPPLSPVKTRGRLILVSMGPRQKVRIFEGRVSGLPFLLLDFKRRFASVSRDAVVWKKCSGSLETLIVMIDGSFNIAISYHILREWTKNELNSIKVEFWNVITVFISIATSPNPWF